MAACKKCLDAVARHLPKIKAEQRCGLLISATCYPCGNCEETERQIIELSEKTDGTYGACCVFADSENDRLMAAMLDVDTKECEELDAAVA